MPQTGSCPHPEKTAYRSMNTARKAAMRNATGAYRSGRHYPGVHAYKCECGMYHLTSRKFWNGKRLVLMARVRPARYLVERGYNQGRLDAIADIMFHQGAE